MADHHIDGRICFVELPGKRRIAVMEDRDGVCRVQFSRTIRQLDHTKGGIPKTAYTRRERSNLVTGFEMNADAKRGLVAAFEALETVPWGKGVELDLRSVSIGDGTVLTLLTKQVENPSTEET